MEKEYVVEGNKLLAHYMGYEYIPHNNPHGWVPGWWKKTTHPRFRLPGMQATNLKLGSDNFLCRNHNELRYYNSWGWMMDVVEKMEKDGFDITIGKSVCEISLNHDRQAYIHFEGGAYACVVFFNDESEQQHLSGFEPITKLQAIFLLITQLLKYKTDISRIFA